MKLIIYGDIHGCFDEWQELREKLNPDKYDIEFSVGDIVDRGPKEIEALRFTREINIKMVRGNHEDKYIRYFKWYDEYLKSGKKFKLNYQKKNRNYFQSFKLRI